MPTEPSSTPVDLYESGRQITSSPGGVGKRKCKSPIPASSLSRYVTEADETARNSLPKERSLITRNSRSTPRNLWRVGCGSWEMFPP
jgi:hypothetical protein